MPSFTIQIPNLRGNGPIVNVNIGVHIQLAQKLIQQKQKVPPPIAAHALFDTGASATVIRDDIPGMLNLKPIGEVPISTVSDHNVKCFIYPINLNFDNQLAIDITAIAAPLHGQNIQCLIGRDILSMGTLFYNGYMNMVTFSI